MRRLALLSVLVLALAAPVQAAYVTATILTNEPLPDGRVHLAVQFTGNAGEPPITRDLYINGSTTAATLKQWAYDQANDLNGTRTLAGAAALQPGNSVTLQAIAPATLTAQQQWFQLLGQWRRIQQAVNDGILSATAPEVVAFKNNVISLYSSAYINGF